MARQLLIYRARYAAPACLGTKFQRAKAPERIDSIKDLVLEVPRFPLTYRSALSPITSPVARAAFPEAHYQRQQCLSLTRLTIANQLSSRNPRPLNKLTFLAPRCFLSSSLSAESRRSRINTGDFVPLNLPPADNQGPPIYALFECDGAGVTNRARLPHISHRLYARIRPPIEPGSESPPVQMVGKTGSPGQSPALSHASPGTST